MKFGELLTFLYIKDQVKETKVLYSMLNNRGKSTTVYWSYLSDGKTHGYVAAEVVYSITRPYNEITQAPPSWHRLIRADIVFTPYYGNDLNRSFISNANTRQLASHLLS